MLCLVLWFYVLHLGLETLLSLSLYKAWGSILVQDCLPRFPTATCWRGFPGGASGKETTCQRRWCKTPWAWAFSRDDFLEKGMATHSRILAWRVLWTEEPELQRAGRDWSDLACIHLLKRLFSLCIFLPFCNRLIDNRYVGLLLGPCVWATVLFYWSVSVFVPVPLCFDYCSFAV